MAVSARFSGRRGARQQACDRLYRHLPRQKKDFLSRLRISRSRNGRGSRKKWLLAVVLVSPTRTTEREKCGDRVWTSWIPYVREPYLNSSSPLALLLRSHTRRMRCSPGRCGALQVRAFSSIPSLSHTTRRIRNRRARCMRSNEKSKVSLLLSARSPHAPSLFSH